MIRNKNALKHRILEIRRIHRVI